MKLVMTLVVRDEAEVVDAQLAYHLNAGVDFVLATDHASQDGTTEILESYERAGHLRLLRVEGEGKELDGEWRLRMARLAATEHGADWVIETDVNEFWWPRGESLKDALAPIPARYTTVQGLRRPFLARAGAGDLFERMTVRRSLQHGIGESEPPGLWLRPVHRADPSVTAGALEQPRRVPLRAWYPIEVLDFSGRSEQPAHEAELGQGLANGSLVEDTRVLDALRTLRDAASGGQTTYALPSAGTTRLSFRAPDIVDDAAYAVECAAVGEVDLPGLERYVGELEQRVAWLEQRLWPRLLRRASGLFRRSRE
jgi:glycosyl transferase family 2